MRVSEAIVTMLCLLMMGIAIFLTLPALCILRLKYPSFSCILHLKYPKCRGCPLCDVCCDEVGFEL